jgi:hypothetical protein
MAGMVTNPMAQTSAMANQGTSLNAQVGQQNIMNALLSQYLNMGTNPGSYSGSTGASGSPSMYSTYQPLSTGAVEGITNSTNANMAERGLANSPNMLAAAQDTALGNATTGQQNNMLSNFFSGLKLPLSVGHPGVSSVTPQQIQTMGNGILGGAAGGLAGAAAFGL